MGTPARWEYFRVLRIRYQEATSKNQRTRLVDEAVVNTGLHRKSVIRALGRARHPEGGPPRWGRPRKFSGSCLELLKRLYRASDFQCSDKLRAMIPIMLGQLRRPIDALARSEVLAMSPASIDRYLRQYRAIERRRCNTRTRPGSRLFKKQIPLKSLGNIAPRPGYLQADTVSHGGESTLGEYIWSLTVTDERTGWTENQGFRSKCSRKVLPAIQATHESLPFDLIAINVDNGSEFLNARVYEYFRALAERKVIAFPMTRSRAYRKNDNCHVEQKNWTTVRQLFGYDRLEDEELVPLMNEIYRVQGLISNFFIPQYKLKSKVRVGSKIKKTYDKPKTPYQRLLEEPTLPNENKRKLREQYAKLNYFDLVEERETLLARFEALKRDLSTRKSG